MGPITEMESVSIIRTAAQHWCLDRVRHDRRVCRPARHVANSEESSWTWGLAWQSWERTGRPGVRMVQSGVMDRATANTSPRTSSDHKQDDQTVKSKSPAGSCSQGLDQCLGSTRAHSSRNRPLEWPSTMAGLLRGWTGRSPPLTPKPTDFARTTSALRMANTIRCLFLPLPYSSWRSSSGNLSLSAACGQRVGCLVSVSICLKSP